jgi:hypothetical protein
MALLTARRGGRVSVLAHAAGGEELAALVSSLIFERGGGTFPIRAASALLAAEEAALRRLAVRRGERDLFLLLRRNPLELLRRLPAERALDPALLALLFAGLPAEERREAEAMAKALSGPGARGSLRGEAVLHALAAAAASAASSSGPASFARLWREALAAESSPAELAWLDRLLPMAVGPSAKRRREAKPSPERGSAAWLIEVLEGPPDVLARELALLRSPALGKRLARRLPRHLLTRLLFAARPREARALLGAAELVRGAFAAQGRSLSPEALWESLLNAVTAPPGAAAARLAQSVLKGASDDGALAEALLARARSARHGPLAAAVEEEMARSPSASKRPRRPAEPAPTEPATVDPRSPFGSGGSEPIALVNAGLVLAAPFMPQLFSKLGLAAPDSAGRLAWVEPEAAGRAVHLLQFLVDERTDAPEPLLPLNKILCGLDPSWPSLASIELSTEEADTCHSLLQAMLASWPMMATSSTAALRETFLQREGRLERTEAGWKLEVERKTLDVLMDGLPWSFSLILAPWMPEPLAVSW